jgi:hypothetical protein
MAMQVMHLERANQAKGDRINCVAVQREAQARVNNMMMQKTI